MLKDREEMEISSGHSQFDSDAPGSCERQDLLLPRCDVASDGSAPSEPARSRKSEERTAKCRLGTPRHTYAPSSL